MYIGLRVKYPSFLTDFNEKSSFAKDFFRNPHLSILKKIRPVEAEFFHADRQTDRHEKFKVAVRNFFKRA